MVTAILDVLIAVAEIGLTLILLYGITRLTRQRRYLWFMVLVYVVGRTLAGVMLVPGK
ncbi:hypothetical protein [Mycobacterium leprae]|uniref:hypothetical protein n=1 Tax=Mycobacterium leprae TaxID=1769 RepID=UPI0002E73BE2|nr:hypothetical protein [Mycobacterium leprae]